MCGSYFAYNGWQMHWPVLGWRRRLGVCLHWLISQTKRVSRPTSCVGSDQTAGRSCRGSGKGPCPPGKTRWALSVTASITSLWTNELFTERGHLKSSVVLVTVTEMKSSTECKNQMLYSVLSCEKASLFVFTTVFSLLVSKNLHQTICWFYSNPENNLSNSQTNKTIQEKVWDFSHESPPLLGAVSSFWFPTNTGASWQRSQRERGRAGSEREQDSQRKRGKKN